MLRQHAVGCWPNSARAKWKKHEETKGLAAASRHHAGTKDSRARDISPKGLQPLARPLGFPLCGLGGWAGAAGAGFILSTVSTAT